MSIKYLLMLLFPKNIKVSEGAVANMSKKSIPDFMYATTASFIVSIPLIVSEVNIFTIIYKTHANSMA
jgi:hypothetical protein